MVLLYEDVELNLGIYQITTNCNYLISYKSIPLFQTIRNLGTLNLLDNIFTTAQVGIFSIYVAGR